MDAAPRLESDPVSTRTRARVYDTLPTLLPSVFGDPGTVLSTAPEN